jgi:hypothetical protein
MQLLGYEGFIKAQLLAIKSIKSLQTFGAMRLPTSFPLKFVNSMT